MLSVTDAVSVTGNSSLRRLLRAIKGLNYVLHVISLDVIVDSTWGDVSDQKTRTFWLEAIKARWVLGFFWGPPCESWSECELRVMNFVILTCRASSEIGRSLPWGCECVSLKEAKQLLIGNCLLGFSLEAILEIAASQGFGLLGHPAEPEELPIVEVIIALPGVCKFRFSQGLMGAPTPKPTDLLAVNM